MRFNLFKYVVMLCIYSFLHVKKVVILESYDLERSPKAGALELCRAMEDHGQLRYQAKSFMS